MFVYPYGGTWVINSDKYNRIICSWSGNSISYFQQASSGYAEGDSRYQCNGSGQTYWYHGIG